MPRRGMSGKSKKRGGSRRVPVPMSNAAQTRRTVIRNLNQSRRARRARGRPMQFGDMSPMNQHRVRLAAERANYAPRTNAATRAVVANNPSRNRFLSARQGKFVAAGVVAAGAINALSNRTGRGLDRTRGRPTGIFGY